MIKKLFRYRNQCVWIESIFLVESNIICVESGTFRDESIVFDVAGSLQADKLTTTTIKLINNFVMLKILLSDVYKSGTVAFINHNRCVQCTMIINRHLIAHKAYYFEINQKMI